MLKDSQLAINQPYFSVLDGLQRSFDIVPESLPITVLVTAPEGGPVPNPLDPLPDSEPLEQHNLDTASDQLVVYDPNTGYDWIRLDISRDIPIPVMLDLLSNHPALTGFSVARYSQVINLILNYL